MVAFDGRVVKCKGVAEASLNVAGIDLNSLFTVVDHIVGNVDVVLGMDVIEQLGGVLVGGDRVQFGNLSCSVRCDIVQTVSAIGSVTIILMQCLMAPNGR